MRKLLLLHLLMLVCLVNSYAQCSVSFTTTPNPQQGALLNTHLTTGHTPLSSGSYTSYDVLWGDGGYDILMNEGYSWPAEGDHGYLTTGSKTIMVIMHVFDSLTATEICRDTETHAITVAYPPCATQISYAVSGSTVTATAVTPAGSTGLTYNWEWGGPSNTTTGNPSSYTFTPTMRTPSVLLKVTGPGCSYEHGTMVYIPPAAGSCAGSANFVASYQSLLATYSSMIPVFPGKRIVSYWWSFGDGTTTTITDPKVLHQYTTPAMYPVKHAMKWIDSATGAYYCTDTFTNNIQIQGVNLIEGNIYQDSFLTRVPYPQYKVWLIQKDSAVTTLTAVDSQTITGSQYGFSTHYNFGIRSATDSFLVKAKMLNGPATGTGALPTYHYSSLLWSGANDIRGFNFGFSKDIRLQYGTVTAGPGFVGGNISAGANKGTATGIANMTVLLMDNTGKALAHATTDANGDYRFPGIAYGTYTVYPEDAGYRTTPVTATISSGTPSYTAADFKRSIKNRTITPFATGISNINDPVSFILYPNPAKDNVTITWNSTITRTINITITDITGKKVKDLTATGGHADLNMGQLQKGLYLITTEAGGSRQTQKLLLQ